MMAMLGASAQAQPTVPAATPLAASAQPPAKLGPRAITIAERCAIKPDQTIGCWDAGSSPLPSGKFVTLASDGAVYCAVRADGTAVCWDVLGAPAPRPHPQPAGKFLAVWPLGGERFCAIRADRSAECWVTPLVQTGGKLGYVIGKVYRIPGRYQYVVWTNANTFALLDVEGRVSVKALDGSPGRAPAAPAGNYQDVHVQLGQAALLRTDGVIVGLGATSKDDQEPISGYIAMGDGCALRADGQIDCGERIHRGPFVDIMGRYFVQPDGRAFNHNTPEKLIEIRLPDDVRNRKLAPYTGPRRGVPLLDELVALEASRSATGSEKQYRVALRSWDAYEYAAFDAKGVSHFKMIGDDAESESVHSYLTKWSDILLIDINGEQLELGDPLYLKVTGSYVVVGAKGLTLSKKPTPEARWTLHSATWPKALRDERRRGPENPVIDPYAGAYGLLLRAANGDFLVPCSDKTNCTPALKALVNAKSASDSYDVPWWVRDPFFQDTVFEENSQKMFAQRGTQWTLWPVIDCRNPKRSPWGKASSGCAVTPVRHTDARLRPEVVESIRNASQGKKK